MKILFICHSSPFKEGGAETRNRLVAAHFARMGHQVTIFCAKTGPDDPSEKYWEGIRILQRRVLPRRLLKRYPYPSYLPLVAANCLLMFHLYFFLKKECFDFIREDISPVPPSGLLAMFRLGSARRVAIVHNLSAKLRGWVKYYGKILGLFGYGMNRLLRSNRLKYDRIICDGSWFADELKGHAAIRDRVEYIPNGVDLALFRKEGQLPNSSGGRRLLCVGRLVETKGHSIAVMALSELNKEWPDVRLTIVGNGPLRHNLESMARDLGVSDKLEILNPVEHSKMPEFFRSHDYFLMPSRFEGLPIVLLEAMASGIPIVASDIPAIRSVVDESSAVLFREGDSEDLVKKLSANFQDSSQLRGKSSRAASLAKNYSWQTVAEREVDLYRPIIAD